MLVVIVLVAAVLPFGHFALPWYFFPGVAWGIALGRARDAATVLA